ncbi:MAG: hypothetical protein ACRDN6_05490 [Gaiellaceae bacterium]
MSDEGLTSEELEQTTGDPLPDREAMSVITPLGEPVDGGDEILFPAEPDIGDPATP